MINYRCVVKTANTSWLKTCRFIHYSREYLFNIVVAVTLSLAINFLWLLRVIANFSNISPRQFFRLIGESSTCSRRNFSASRMSSSETSVPQLNNCVLESRLKHSAQVFYIDIKCLAVEILICLLTSSVFSCQRDSIPWKECV